MSKKALANDLVGPTRRSTRINRAIQLKVTGVDSYRGPYCEQVTAENISCHGLRFKSKFDVLTDSQVMLELSDKKERDQPVFARGVVKWTRRPGEGDQNGLFHTAVELEDPGNIWGVVSPPEDWLPFCLPRKPIRVYVKPTAPVAPRAVPSIATAEDASKGEPSHNSKSTLPLPSIERQLGPFMVAFQATMEEMFSEAAAAAVRKEMTNMRDELRKEAEGIIARVSAAHIETHSLQLDQLSQSMSARLVERFRTSLEACRRDAVDHNIDRLKEQLSPPLEDARKVTIGLIEAKGDLEEILGEITGKTSTKIRESCTHFEREFETAIRGHLAAASAELDRARQSTILLTLDNLRVSAKEYEALVQVRFQSLDQISETALTALKKKSTEISHRSTEALTSYSRRHLEFVSNAISELAKDLWKESLPL
jgi:hypothetical protein